MKDRNMFLMDLPWKLMTDLIVLDYDDGWEKLASELDYTTADVKKLKHFLTQGKSPTHEMILKWSYKEATIYDLWEVLLKIDRLAEASAIEAFLKAKNMPMRERPLNNISNQIGSHHTAATCESLRQLNLSCLPRPSERNLLQPKSQSHLPPPTAQTPFHKPLNIDGHKQNISINMNKVTHHKELERVPKVDFEESQEAAAKPVPASKDISSLIPCLELGCHYTYKQVSSATNGFSEENLLGSGAFGTVYYGKLKQTDCAIKKLTKDYSEVNNAMIHIKKNSLEELTIQLKYRHPNVVSLFGYSLDFDETCFIYEYMENGSLEDCLACVQNKPPLTWGERLKIAQGAACGLQYLHTQATPVIHGDVKSSNILIDKYKEAKIGDFGLAMFATNGTDTGILTHVSSTMSDRLFGTFAYMPPEFARSNGKHHLAGDVYSFGVVLHEILTGQKAYDEHRKPKRFLMEYIEIILESADDDFNNDEENNNELPSGINNIIDPKAGPCFMDTIKYLYKLATKCIRSKKKDRPCMLAVFEDLERINIQFAELMKGATEVKPNSLPYQLQQMYDERNQQSSSVASPESADEETCLFRQGVSCSEMSLKEEDFSLGLNTTDDSETSSIPVSDSLRKKYQEKSLPPSMGSFFEKYKQLSSDAGDGDEDGDEDGEENSDEDGDEDDEKYGDEDDEENGVEYGDEDEENGVENCQENCKENSEENCKENSKENSEENCKENCQENCKENSEENCQENCKENC